MEDISRVKDGTPTDEELEELGDKIVENWKKLGRRLCVTDSKLLEIEKDHEQISEKGYYMLKHWKQEKGCAATYQALCGALKHKLVQRQDLAEQFCYINGPFASQLPAGHVAEEKVTEEVCGASAGVYRRASAKHQEDSTEVKSSLKQKRLDPNPDQGNLPFKISCLRATSRNSGNQDPEEEREKVNRYMKEKIDEVNSRGIFDFSDPMGIRCFYMYLMGELYLQNVTFQSSSIKVIVKCRTLEILENLWCHYCSGQLNAVAEECLITENVKEELGMETIKLKTTILEEDYVTCKLCLMEIPVMAESQVRSPSDAKLDFDDLNLKAIATVYLEEGNKEYRRKEASNALSFYTQGLQVNCKDDILNAKLYSNRATAYFSQGNYQETLNDAEAAVTLQPTFIKAMERGAKACVKLKRYEEATSWCDKGLAIDKNNKTFIDLRTKCVNQPDTSQETKRQNMKGTSVTHIATGQKGADSLPKTAKDEVGDKCEEGNASDRQKDFKKAIQQGENVLKILKDMGAKALEGIAYGNLGNAYQSLGDFKTAINYHERYLKIAKEVGDKAGEGRAYGNLGNAYQSLGDLKTAIDYHERDLKIAKEAGDKAGEGSAYGNLGDAYQSLGDFKTAIDYHERHLKIAKEVGDKAGTATSFFNLGKIFESQQCLPEAISCFYTSVKMFNIIRDGLKGEDEWKISYRNMCETAYTSLWRLLLEQGEVEKALFAAEEGRAQALNDLMELNYGFKTTFCQSPHLEESTQNLLIFPRSVTAFMAINEQDIVFWVVQDGKDVQLRTKKLVDKSSLNDFLEYLIEDAFQELVVRAGVKCKDRLLGDEHVGNERSLQMSVLRTLYDDIIDPIADLIHGDELILVPEGPLCLAPYAALLDSNSRYLCDVCRIRVIPSLTSLKRITDSPGDYHSKTGMLLVGDPWVQEVVISGEIKLEQLPFAREEVEMIGKIFNTAPLIGKEATKGKVLERLPPAALIHIAARGRMETGEIVLAPNTTRASQVPAEEDFLLTMKDVTSSRIHARLVVLSFSHSGRGKMKAEGIVGIARAFLGAGARAVLVSLWAIDDEATLEFMRSFYTHLVKGISASESLNKAMKCMRQSDEFNEVKHWAPFVLIGDDVTLEFDGNE